MNNLLSQPIKSNNLSINPLNIYQPTIKQSISNLTCKSLHTLNNVTIFAIPTRINDKDILSMFKGLLSLISEKSHQQQTAKYLTLKLKYEHLYRLYRKKSNQLRNKQLYKKATKNS